MSSAQDEERAAEGRATGKKTFLLKQQAGRALRPADPGGLPAK